MLRILLSQSENYEREDIKYYLYHLISAFSQSKEKLINDLELLLKNYEIKDFHEYFSINDNFLLTIEQMYGSIISIEVQCI